jgi:predicted DNA-binding mobile mystery protein A
MNLKQLQTLQTDDMLTPWRRGNLSLRPSGGWVRAIREALGMTAAALGRRVGIRSSSVLKLERAEAADTITLATLRKVAAALDCELQYALVPRRPLEDMRRERALELARKQLRPVSHSMALEDQAVSGSSRDRQIRLLAEEILRGSRRDFWTR